MIKHLILGLAVLGLAIRAYFMYEANQVQAARQTLQSHQTIDQIRRNVQGGPDAEADAAAHGKTTAAGGRTPTPQTGVVGGNPQGKVVGNNPNPAANTDRQEIDASLKAMHLTTIMPGQPGLVIIDKQEYSEGESLPLPKGRKAQIVRVEDDGVRLTCNGMDFHLDPPAAPDLAALRKKKP